MPLTLAGLESRLESRSTDRRTVGGRHVVGVAVALAPLALLASMTCNDGWRRAQGLWMERLISARIQDTHLASTTKSGTSHARPTERINEWPERA